MRLLDNGTDSWAHVHDRLWESALSAIRCFHLQPTTHMQPHADPAGFRKTHLPLLFDTHMW